MEDARPNAIGNSTLKGPILIPAGIGDGSPGSRSDGDEYPGGLANKWIRPRKRVAERARFEFIRRLWHAFQGAVPRDHPTRGGRHWRASTPGPHQ